MKAMIFKDAEHHIGPSAVRLRAAVVELNDDSTCLSVTANIKELTVSDSEFKVKTIHGFYLLLEYFDAAEFERAKKLAEQFVGEGDWISTDERVNPYWEFGE